MTAEEIQIVELAGQGASVEEISDQLQLEPSVVKFCLTRQGMLKEDEISDDDFKDIQDGLLQLAKYSENEFVKAKVGIFLYERKKGPTSSMKGAPAVNIGNLNVLIASSHQRILNALQPDRSHGSGTTGSPKVLPQQTISLPETSECKAVEAAD